MNKKLLLLSLFLLTAVSLFAQDTPKDWMLKSPVNGIYGMDVDGAYKFLTGKKSTTVIVAIIDSGVEVDHPDLKDNIWVNPKEIPGNGIDDDANGYIDDIHGWDFIGGKDGDVHHDTYELARLYKLYTEKFSNVNPSTLSGDDKLKYAEYQKIKPKFEADKKEADQEYAFYEQIYSALSRLLDELGTKNPTMNDIERFKTDDKQLATAKLILQSVMSKGSKVSEVMDELEEGKKYFESKSKYGLNPDYNPRTIVGDNYDDANDRNYGNNEVEGPDAMHGTHVSGIVGAIRNNNVGIDGICENVKIMVLRAVPDGDERDKDVANAIIYAVNNGAKVINMSFGKQYVYNKKAVDEAIKYAMSKDVLLVHGAGNDALNCDIVTVYPNDQMMDNSVVSNFLNVGANDITGNTASFSNYGKKNVDVFAPGVQIYSTMTDYTYKYLDGTSMASPAACGVAALIRSYYPNLTASQVKEIMIKSAYKPKLKVSLPGSEKKKTTYKKLCVSGGMVNALNAVKLAESMSK
jgi:subtilisin family serine protease